MIDIEGQPVLTAAQMRVAEERAAPTPDAMYALMERAGAGVADAVRRLAAGAEALILCGPGNNGDGYVAARLLREWGHPVRVAALAEPSTDLARRARAAWTGPVEALADAAPAPVVVDALFGTGLDRPLDTVAASLLRRFVQQARLSIAVDLPSGVATDDAALLSAPPQFDLTLALGALKPAHVLQPAAEVCGAVRLIDLGLPAVDSPVATLAPPDLTAPGPADHKYTRGLTIVIGGAMPGATSLAITAAMRAGAGYGLLFTDQPGPDLPHAVVQRRWSSDALAQAIAGKKTAVVVIGPGLGRDDEARAKLEAAVACGRPLVIDGDALHLLTADHFAQFSATPDRRVVLTPHAGEFAALFGKPAGSKIEQACAAARRAGATVVFKGSDTVVAHPDGRARVRVGARSWLSTAGTGDVLSGAIAGVWQAASEPAEAGVWLHAEAARRCGASFIADDLVDALTPARASCR